MHLEDSFASCETGENMFWYLTLGLVASCWYLLEKYVKVPYEKSEPPLIPSSFPYVGHLIGILRHGSKYYSEIR